MKESNPFNKTDIQKATIEGLKNGVHAGILLMTILGMTCVVEARDNENNIFTHFDSSEKLKLAKATGLMMIGTFGVAVLTNVIVRTAPVIIRSLLSKKS